MRRLHSPALAAAALWIAWGVSAASGAPLQADSTTERRIPPAPVARAAEWETLTSGLPEEARFRKILRLRYNRVDGPAPTVGAAFQTARGSAPIVFAEATYAYSRERGLYEGGFEVPIGDRPRVRVGASAYRRTATEDDWIVAEGENTIFALVARTDYRDHYESQGAQLDFRIGAAHP